MSQTNDEQAIQDTIQIYFDCMHESSAEKAHLAFNPKAKITGYIRDKLYEMSVDDFANMVAARQPSPKSSGDAARLEVISLDIAGETAIARVRDDYIGNTYLDTLSFLKTNDQWQIYNKLFHIEA